MPEQCLIGNRAANNYPCARIRARQHARSHWLKLGHTGADCVVATTTTIKIGAARRTRIDDTHTHTHVNTLDTKQKGERQARDARFIVVARHARNYERLRQLIRDNAVKKLMVKHEEAINICTYDL